MKIAVLSDIHGNYVAFERCIEYAEIRGIDTYIFLGDYVAEFPYPQNTMEKLYSLRDKYTCFFVKGNKEDYWINRKYDTDCEWKGGNHTVGAMQYCYENLTKKDMDFFLELSPTEEIAIAGAAPILACHGSPRRNNEKMLPTKEETNRVIDECPYKYILCGHTHIQGLIERSDKKTINPGAVGVPLYSNGKTQFMVLHQNGQEWIPEFVSLDYDRERVFKEMKESGLENLTPYWTRVTKHLIMTGNVSHGDVLERAMSLCMEETGKAIWYDIPDIYWEKAIEQLLK